MLNVVPAQCLGYAAKNF